MHIEINLPYSIREIFNPTLHKRLKEIRAAAKAACTKPGSAARYLCTPQILALRMEDIKLDSMYQPVRDVPIKYAAQSEGNYKKVRNILRAMARHDFTYS